MRPAIVALIVLTAGGSLSAEEPTRFEEGRARQNAQEVRSSCAGTLLFVEGVDSVGTGGIGTQYRLLIVVRNLSAKHDARKRLGGDTFKGLPIVWFVRGDTASRTSARLPRVRRTPDNRSTVSPSRLRAGDSQWRTQPSHVWQTQPSQVWRARPTQRVRTRLTPNCAASRGSLLAYYRSSWRTYSNCPPHGSQPSSYTVQSRKVQSSRVGYPAGHGYRSRPSGLPNRQASLTRSRTISQVRSRAVPSRTPTRTYNRAPRRAPARTYSSRAVRSR